MWFNSFFPWYILNTKDNKKLYKFENDIEYQNTFVNLINLATYCFKWEGLPPTCNARILELTLLFNGMACIVNDTEYGFINLKCTPCSESLNIYGDYSKINGYGANGFTRLYNNYMEGSYNELADAVVCRDNIMCYPYYYYLLMGAKRLTNAMRSIDVATKKLKVPYFVTCDESQYTSVQKILNDIEGNKDTIIVNKSTLPDMFKVLPTSVDSNVINVLWNSYNNYDNYLKTLLGIDSCTNKDKAERLLVDEVNADSVISDINIRMRLKSRETFCKQINEHFGLNISVSLNEEIINKGVKDNEVGDSPFKDTIGATE